jgi:hypothetical protein
MKKTLIGILFTFVLVFLGTTRSLYVEKAELLIIFAAIFGWTSIIHLFSKKQKLDGNFIMITLSGFFLCCIFGAADIILDHYLYYLPKGKEDGAALTLGFKLEEFSDDLYLASMSGMLIAVISSFILRYFTKRKAF